MAEEKSEYLDGHVVAMAGASGTHVLINSNLTVRTGMRLIGGPCTPYPSDLRVALHDQSPFAYPDLTIVCGDSVYLDDAFDTLLNPTVIFEVLSPSTEKWDRGWKLARYLTIPSLKEVILVSQTEPKTERYSRDGKDWLFAISMGLDSTLVLPSLGIDVPLSEIYDRVRFDSLSSPKPEA